MAIPPLKDTTLFTVALNFFNNTFANINSDLTNASWGTIKDKAIASVSHAYPELPLSIQHQMVSCISWIACEYDNFTKAAQQLLSVVNTVHPFEGACVRKTYWTPYFTIHRTKMICAIFKRHALEKHATFLGWVELVWNQLPPEDRRFFHTNYQRYSRYMFYQMICYNPLSLLARQYRNVNMGKTIVENALMYVVMMGDLDSMRRFFRVMPAVAQQQIAFDLATYLLDNFDQIIEVDRPSTKLAISFLCLWQYLRDEGKKDIVCTHFVKILDNVIPISFPSTDSLVSSINLYPAGDTAQENRQILKHLIHRIVLDSPAYKKFQKVFHLYFKKVESTLNEWEVVELLEKLLMRNDIDSALLMMTSVGSTKKMNVFKLLKKYGRDIWSDAVDAELSWKFYSNLRSSFVQENRIDAYNSIM